MDVKPHSIAHMKLFSRSGDLAEFSDYISYVVFHTRSLVALQVLFTAYWPFTDLSPKVLEYKDLTQFLRANHSLLI